MITEKDYQDFEAYDIHGQFYGFLKETAEMLEAAGYENLQHLCSRFSVAFDNFMRRENPEVFEWSKRDRMITSYLNSMTNTLNHVAGQMVELQWKLDQNDK